MRCKWIGWVRMLWIHHVFYFSQTCSIIVCDLNLLGAHVFAWHTKHTYSHLEQMTCGDLPTNLYTPPLCIYPSMKLWDKDRLFTWTIHSYMKSMVQANYMGGNAWKHCLHTKLSSCCMWLSFFKCMVRAWDMLGRTWSVEQVACANPPTNIHIYPPIWVREPS